MELGTEEGCPEIRPENLDEIISRPIQIATQMISFVFFLTKIFKANLNVKFCFLFF